jgi:[ribosomal protein S18]-alanine N-acetyltransferase
LQARRLVEGDRNVVLDLAREAGFQLNVDEELARPFAEVWIGERPPMPVCVYALFWKVGDDLELLQLVTQSATRRTGAALELLGAVFENARQRGIQAVFLEVRAGNEPARKLYEALGFEQTRLRRAYYSDGEDAVEMRHALRDKSDT